ncbi:MAG: aminoglycoside phosphotransferase family protein [Chloroflexi bacterium]|nr:aminoglycoside phosphotransferase family protein [Chloroflexota bacterium]MDA1240661.1 aminoglycoside phosphotransferase family protein [Chloroflexota bacterium]
MPTDDRPALTPEVAQALHATLPGCDPARATVAGAGWDVTAWRVPAPDGDWTVRVPRHADAAAVIESQHRLNELLAGHGLPVPPGSRLLRDEQGRLLAGLYRYVDGTEARPVGRAARQRLTLELGDFLTRLHPLAGAAKAAGLAVPHEPWPEVWSPLIDRCAALLPPRTEGWIRATGVRLERASRVLPPPVLVHADLKSEHVLLGADGTIAAVLDFEGVQITDPAVDFARIIQAWGRPFAERVLAAYRGTLDVACMERAQAYRDIEALQAIDNAEQYGQQALLPWARRDLASRAAAATRRG